MLVFDGIDGCGKSTHARFVSEYLISKGLDVVFLKEPTVESPAGKILRHALRSGKRPEPEEELHLFVEDRRWDVENRIIPSLNSGKTVVLDRYYYSTVAYQGALGIDLDMIWDMNSFAPKPDIAFILDIEPEEGIKRISRRRNSDYFEELDYLRKVREIFLSMRKMPEVRIIDSSRDRGSVRNDVMKIVDSMLS